MFGIKQYSSCQLKYNTVQNVGVYYALYTEHRWLTPSDGNTSYMDNQGRVQRWAKDW